MKADEQQEIFQQWLRQYKGLLIKIVRAYASHSSEQDDLFQEISLQVWRSIPSFREESAVSTWIYRVGFNTAIKWAKKERKYREGRETMAGKEQILGETLAPSDERLAWLYHQIASLDEIDRSLCLLLLDGQSYKDMAAILGISASNVGVKIHRIKKHLTSKAKQYQSYGI